MELLKEKWQWQIELTHLNGEGGAVKCKRNWNSGFWFIYDAQDMDFLMDIRDGEGTGQRLQVSGERRRLLCRPTDPLLLLQRSQTDNNVSYTSAPIAEPVHHRSITKLHGAGAAPIMVPLTTTGFPIVKGRGQILLKGYRRPWQVWADDVQAIVHWWLRFPAHLPTLLGWWSFWDVAVGAAVKPTDRCCWKIPAIPVKAAGSPG